MRPIVGVAGVVLHEGQVLLVRRGRPPLLGKWSLPGGALKVGETIVAGVAREVFEETGLRVTPLAQVATLDRILRDEDGGVQFHYVLLDWLCRLAEREPADTPEPVAGGDALEAGWAPLDDLSGWDGLDEVAMGVIRDAAARLSPLEEGGLRCKESGARERLSLLQHVPAGSKLAPLDRRQLCRQRGCLAQVKEEVD